MAIDDLRRQLIEAGLELVRRQLVARTWGNLSVRAGEGRFLITPSGIPYEELEPADLVLVDLETLEYEGTLKPSSEKGLHAMVYRSRSEIGAVIHTHQFWASAAAVSRRELPATGTEDAIPCADYALPTTKALTRSVERCMAVNDARSFLLANHGALCLGATLEETVAEASELERRVRARILSAAGLRESDSDSALIGAWRAALNDRRRPA